MANDSTEEGYIAPSLSAPYDTTLENILHDAIVGMTGLAGALVRPRWQPAAPVQPAYDVNWCAFGIVRTPVDAFAYEHHDTTGQGSNSVDRDEILEVLHSFYGPAAHAYCERFRDGFEVSQNRAVLQSHGVGLIEVGEASILPALLKEQWVKRVDATVKYRRRTSRKYPVLTIVSAQGQLSIDSYTVSLNVNN